jgi:hypothetical protein
MTETLLTPVGPRQEAVKGFWSPDTAFCIEIALIALTSSAPTGVQNNEHMEQIKLARQTADPDA